MSAARSAQSAGAALLLSIVLATTAAASSTSAAGIGRTDPAGAGMQAPIHAFDWPAGPPNDPYYGNQIDLTTVGLPAAWPRTTGTPSVVVAVLDTGIDATHPEFSGRLVPGYDALHDKPDSSADYSPTNDDEGHGTHVSGTVAAAANNGQGIAGIAPGVSIMPVKVLDSAGGGQFEDMVIGMNWAIGHGARIITLSLGGTLSPAGVANLQPTFDAAYAAGAVVVAASGNDGASIDEYPCNFAHVICVGSTTTDGGTVSTFSTRTTGLALVAPGEGVVSALPGNSYGYGTGTSMATPHVTGAVALLRALDSGLSVDQVFADLTQSARPLVVGGRNSTSGYGLLQVGAALDLAAGGTPVPTPTPSPTPTPAPGAGPSVSPDPSASSSPGPDPAGNPTPTPTPPTAPTVVSATPRNGTRGVLRAIRPRLSFSVRIAGVSTRTITMLDLSRGRRVTIHVSYSTSSQVATVTPTVRLAANHSYRILASGITSVAGGVALRRTYAVTFRTGYR